MNKLQSLKRRFYSIKLWIMLGRDCLFGHINFEITKDQSKDQSKAKDECLRQALEALEAIGKRHHGGSRYARATHAFLTTQLQGVGVVL
jgi:hypothetical protein